jgi:hypothetical protein
MIQGQISDAQVGLLWHTLGLRPELGERGRHPYRNFYGTTVDAPEAPDLDAMVGAGLMVRTKAPAFCPADEVVWQSTEDGKRVAIASLPPPPKRTNFDAYLDTDGGYDSFPEFLGINQPRYQERSGRGNREYRMVRYRRRNVSRFHSQEYLQLCESVEVAGDWCTAKKDAKASYKSALNAARPARKDRGDGF